MRLVVLVLAVVLISTAPAHAYSVLSHEANVDVLWDPAIVPVLKARFPHATDDELRDARAYAYGGCVIQDLGYYPFGSHFFSDLLHYVHSGDFVWRLIADANDVDDLAFALGALSHYSADSEGHPLGVNRVVPLMYPKLRHEYGDWITYAENPKRHLLVEFSFDVVQAASGVYASEAYHKFIGFKVAVPLLQQAFRETYGLELKDLFSNFDLAIGTYRHAVSEIIPEMTKVAWRDKRKEILKVSPQMQEATFVFHLTPREYAREYGVDFEKPKWWARLFGVMFKLLPKFGPLATLSFKVPTPEAERIFLDSFNATQQRYRALLTEARKGELNLPNLDLDTGYPAKPGEYSLADKTCAKLVEKLYGDAVRNASCNP